MGGAASSEGVPSNEAAVTRCGGGLSCCSRGCTCQACTNFGDNCRGTVWERKSTVSKEEEAALGDIMRQSGQEVGPSLPAVCRLRIIEVSDVYLLDNLPALKTLVAKESEGCKNVITALPGDFLAPSLLSSLDAGFSMIKALNQIPINLLCFGNHDGNDIAYSKLKHRIQEFEGQWLNSNIPDFVPKLPERYVRPLTGEDGTPAVRTVAFLGLCIGGGKFQAMYREDAFGGAHKTIVPVLEAVPAAVEACRSAHPELDEIIPLTHQDMEEDREMARMGIFPVILGGHDHDQTLETHGENGCRVVKPGMDATHAAVIDLVWTSSDPKAHPTVTVAFKEVTAHEPEPELAHMCEKAQNPVRELETAGLYELRGTKLTSVAARYGDVSMARMLATSVRDCLGCDAVVINSGTVRGNREYTEVISYGDLKRECPFQSAMVVVSMPFSVLRNGIKRSRKPWWDLEEGQSPKECAAALQVDDGIVMVNHEPTTIGNQDVNPDDDERLFNVCCDHYVLRKNDFFKKYCAEYPDRVPPSDCGRPLLPILVEFFCTRMWQQIIDGATLEVMGRDSAHEFQQIAAKSRLSQMAPTCTDRVEFEKGAHKIFEMLDANGDGVIETAELQDKVRSLMGAGLSSSVVVEQLMQMVDADNDGTLSEVELRTAIRKVAPR